MNIQYTFLEDVAIGDIAFEAYGQNLNELFENAAIALFESMANIHTIKNTLGRKIEHKNNRIDALLFDFLSEIVFLKDKDSIVFNKVDVNIKETDSGFILQAIVYGDIIDGRKQELRADVKAVTLHMFNVEKTQEGYKATIVLDV